MDEITPEVFLDLDPMRLYLVCKPCRVRIVGVFVSRIEGYYRLLIYLLNLDFGNSYSVSGATFTCVPFLVGWDVINNNVFPFLLR